MARSGRALQVVLVSVALALLAPGATAKTWTVGGAAGLKTIIQAIAIAGPGDTVRVLAGTYKEGNIIIRKPVVLMGVDYPVLDGEHKYEILTIAANDVSIVGLKLINTGIASVNDIAAVRAIESKRLRVINNRLVNTFFGIHLSRSSACTIEGNEIHSERGEEHQAGNGIHAWKCDSLSIRDNHVSGHRDGIYFEFVTNSLIENNDSHENLRYGLHFMFSHQDKYSNNTFRKNGAGVAVMYTQGVTMTGNRFEQNWGASSYGLLLKDIRDSFIDKNEFSANTVGVYMEGSSRCNFSDNIFSSNGWAIKAQANCDGNVFMKNNFLANTFDFATNGSLVLNTVEHNYWDKYQGYDLNKDGVGDVPYHPISLYSMVVEKMPASIMLWRSFLVYLMDQSERVIPSITPELVDTHPVMKQL